MTDTFIVYCDYCWWSSFVTGGSLVKNTDTELSANRRRAGHIGNARYDCDAEDVHIERCENDPRL